MELDLQEIFKVRRIHPARNMNVLNEIILWLFLTDTVIAM